MQTPLALLALAAMSLASPTTPRKSCSENDVGYNIQAVIQRAQELSTHSWEYGATAQALLELYNPELSVFGQDPFPDGKLPAAVDNVRALNYAKSFIRTDGQTLVDGNGAVGDPAALGVSALMLGETYFEACDRQTQFVLDAPRWSNGAISHREDVAELWADFVYMAPPYLAYYAVHKNDQDLLREAVKQCGLYRDILGKGELWTHIDGPQSADPGKWSTGNGWAVAGMARVLATVRGWETSRSWSDEVEQLEGWIQEILDGAKSAQLDGGLLRNYITNSSSFGEISGSSIIAAAVYRVAKMNPNKFGAEYTDWAEGVRKELSQHVDEDGILTPAANPLAWADPNPYLDGSPEGQAFGGLLAAAWRDWQC